jgi:hypothetical protein
MDIFQDIASFDLPSQIETFKEEVGTETFRIIAGGASFMDVLDRHSTEFAWRALQERYMNILRELEGKRIKPLEPFLPPFSFTDFIIYVFGESVNMPPQGDDAKNE